MGQSNPSQIRHLYDREMRVRSLLKESMTLLNNTVGKISRCENLKGLSQLRSWLALAKRLIVIRNSNNAVLMRVGYKKKKDKSNYSPVAQLETCYNIIPVTSYNNSSYPVALHRFILCKGKKYNPPGSLLNRSENSLPTRILLGK